MEPTYQELRGLRPARGRFIDDVQVANPLHVARVLLVDGDMRRGLNDAFGRFRDDVRRFENELNGQLLKNEQVRASLQRSEVFQRSLFSAARVAVISMDLAGNFTSFNPFAEELTGYRAEEINGQRSLDRLMLQSELDKLAGGGISEEELRKAVGQLCGGIVLALEDTGSRMSRLGRAELVSGEYQDIDETLRQIKAVTVAEVQELARELAAAPRTVTVVGPFEETETFGL